MSLSIASVQVIRCCAAAAKHKPRPTLAISAAAALRPSLTLRFAQGFTGQREDATIGLYFYNARYYDPVIGRFTQADTIVPEPGNPGSLNRYSYALNNPMRFADPSRRRVCKVTRLCTST
jgi:RHS repeat-associated protein